MKIEEATNIVSSIRDKILSGNEQEVLSNIRTIEWLDAALMSFEEIQQYRAIGTVEELKTMKEYGGFTGIELAEISAALGSLGEYCAIGTLEECRAAVGKQAARMKDGITECCGYDFGTDQFDTDIRFCPKCGRKLDRSDEE